MSNRTTVGNGEQERRAPARIDVMAIVERVRPLIVACETELEERRIPPELVDELYEAGVLRSLLPREFGGLEMHPLDFLDLTYELSRINGSVGWLSIICTGATILVDPEVMAELASGTRLLNAGSVGRIGSARKVDGGYRVTGRWTFASGSPFADYLNGAAFIVDDEGKPILNEQGQPTTVEAVFAVASVTRFENWDGLGLRGTGSNDFEAVDLFVEDRFVFPMGTVAEPFASRPHYGYFYYFIGHSSHALGVARSAIDSFIELAHRPPKQGSYRQVKFGKSQMAKVAVAKADSLVRAARLFAWDATERMHNEACAGEASTEATMLLGQANVFAVRAAKDAVNLIFDSAGVDGVIRGRALERQFRDISTAAQHTASVEESYEPYGTYHLTSETPMDFTAGLLEADAGT